MRTVVNNPHILPKNLEKSSSEVVESSSASVPAATSLEGKYREVKKATDMVFISAGVNRGEFTYYIIADS